MHEILTHLEKNLSNGMSLLHFIFSKSIRNKVHWQIKNVYTSNIQKYGEMILKFSSVKNRSLFWFLQLLLLTKRVLIFR